MSFTSDVCDAVVMYMLMVRRRRKGKEEVVPGAVATISDVRVPVSGGDDDLMQDVHVSAQTGCYSMCVPSS